MKRTRSYNASVAEIAHALLLTTRAIRDRRNKWGWQPVNIKGVARYNIDNITGLNSNEREKLLDYCKTKERKFKVEVVNKLHINYLFQDINKLHKLLARIELSLCTIEESTL